MYDKVDADNAVIADRQLSATYFDANIANREVAIKEGEDQITRQSQFSHEAN